MKYACLSGEVAQICGQDSSSEENIANLFCVQHVSQKFHLIMHAQYLDLSREILLHCVLIAVPSRPELLAFTMVLSLHVKINECAQIGACKQNYVLNLHSLAWHPSNECVCASLFPTEQSARRLSTSSNPSEFQS